jgi:hypothetical protein
MRRLRFARRGGLVSGDSGRRENLAEVEFAGRPGGVRRPEIALHPLARLDNGALPARNDQKCKDSMYTVLHKELFCASRLKNHLKNGKNGSKAGLRKVGFLANLTPWRLKL